MTFDESVTEINAYCFENCVSLEKVTFLGKVTKIGEKAFYNCEKLTDIDLSNVEIISSKAFYNNIFIEKINLPSIKKIVEGTGITPGDANKILIEKGILNSRKPKDEPIH